jgi:DNA-binding response OmpR family regulator
MVSSGESILIVESDPDISDLIARQALKPLGYDTRVVTEAATAIQEAIENPPDLIIANVNLPDLSAQDLLAALASQGLTSPLVVVAEKGQEQRAIQAFRLGATDALLWPARDAEVVRVVERALDRTRATRAGSLMDQQLAAARQEVEAKVRDLKTVLAISRAIISISDQRRLFSLLLDGTLQIAEGDMAWLMLREDERKPLVLKAHRNLPQAWARRLEQPLDDGLGSLVSTSRQPLFIHGEAIEAFRISALGRTAGVLPLRVQEEVIGLLVVICKEEREFDKDVQTLLEAVADFASIYLVNARLVQAIQNSGEAVQASARKQEAVLESLRRFIRDEVQVSIAPLEAMLSGDLGAVTDEQQRALIAIQGSLKRLTSAGKSVPAESQKPG